MRLHAHREGLHAADREVAVHRAGNRAGGVLEEREPLDERLVARDDGAADEVGVATEVLRDRVEHDVGAELERPLEVRRGERVVHDAARARGVREIRGDLIVDRSVFEPVAQAYGALLPEERSRGVALLDIGLQSSSLVVYDGDACVLATGLPISLGARSISWLTIDGVANSVVGRVNSM